MSETWAKAAGYEGFYEVSDMGRVRGVARLDSLGRKVRGRVLKNARRPKARIGAGSYYRIRLSKNAQIFDVSVHALVLSSFIGPRPDGMDACHNDGDVENNSLRNLRWATSQENQRDKIAHGTIANGERNGSAKLTREQVEEIKRSRSGPTEIARRFGISRVHAQRIRRGDNWSHIGTALETNP